MTSFQRPLSNHINNHLSALEKPGSSCRTRLQKDELALDRATQADEYGDTGIMLGQMPASEARGVTAEMDAAHAELERRFKAGDAAAREEAQIIVDELLFENEQKNITSSSIERICDALDPKTGDEVIIIGEPPQGGKFRGYAAFRFKRVGSVFVGGSLGSIKKGAGTQAMARAANAAISENSSLAIAPTYDSEGFYLKLGGEYGAVPEYPGRIGFVGNSLRNLSLKSADPFTYDADGNLVPLSQRFNPSHQTSVQAPLTRHPSKTAVIDSCDVDP